LAIAAIASVVQRILNHIKVGIVFLVEDQIKPKLERAAKI
jgi:hypothetical protein